MAYQNIHRVIHHLEEHSLVPVFYHDDAKIACEVVRSCYEAGVRSFEFTNRGTNAPSVFAALREFVSKNCPEMVLGIGTIFSYQTAMEFMRSGCDFVVSPALVPHMQQVQSASYTLWIPGCATISELTLAHELGARMMKVFPAHALTPEFLRAAKSVMPTLKLMPTGGIEPTYDHLRAWFGAGASCIGLGAQLISKEVIANRDWKKLESAIGRAIALAQEAKIS